MEKSNDWYDGFVEELEKQRGILSKKDAGKVKLDFLIRLGKHISGFSSECQDCEGFRNELSNLAANAGSILQAEKTEKKIYFKTIGKISGHLQKKHRMVEEGQNLAAFIGVGIAIGVGMGAGMKNHGAGIAIGIAIGVAIGTSLDVKAKKEGKII